MHILHCNTLTENLTEMNIFTHFRHIIIETLDSLVASGAIPSGLDFSKITAEPPRESDHGDIATNAAMVLSKSAAMPPRTLAELICNELNTKEEINMCEVAGPGFINIRLTQSFWYHALQDILKAKESYGDSKIGSGVKVNVEYVSVNPTGPMHIGHSRGAIIGDIVANLLKKAGYDVTREYYVNDAGAQVTKLADSLYSRYREALGHKIDEIGEYSGEYLIEPAKKLAMEDKDKWINADRDEWIEYFRSYAVNAMMDIIRKDLSSVNIQHDIFTSEKGIIERGEIEDSFECLNNHNLIYQGFLPKPKGKVLDDWEPKELTLFKSTEFGDDSDRPLKKGDGSWTYLAGDIAYHFDKIQRGFGKIINIWGTDHGGYVKRVAAAVHALSNNKVEFEVILTGMVKFFDNGQAVKMSKRTGTFITIADVVELIGADVLRFMMVTRKADAEFNFDFSNAVEQSKDNLVFYVQYAHARICSIKRHIAEAFPNLGFDSETILNADMKLLSTEEELAMIKLLTQWPRQVEIAAQTGEPHRIAFFLNDIASCFHGLWTKGKDKTELRFVVPGDERMTLAKLALIQGVANVIVSGLKIIGVKPVEEMR